MSEPDLLREEITVQTDIADGLRSRMATQDNGYQQHKLRCVTRTLDRLKRSLAAHERKGDAA